MRKKDYINIKEYLQHAYKLDRQIDSKIDMLASLNDTITKYNAVLDGMPRNPSGSKHMMEDTIVKIVALKDEINADIDELVNMKLEIQKALESIPDIECRIVLEKRYCCYKRWREIASEMGHEIRYIYGLHRKGLRLLDDYHKRVTKF